MSATHIVKEVRNRFVATLTSVANVPPFEILASATILDSPPRDWSVEEGLLPAVYVLNTGERLRRSGVNSTERDIAIAVVLLAKSGGEPQDQLDDLQLAVEQALIDSSFLGGLASELELTEVATNKINGQWAFGQRILNYTVSVEVTSNNPTY